MSTVDPSPSQCPRGVNGSPKLKPKGRLQKRRQCPFSLGRIPKLLMLGYPSEEAQRKYELRRDWARMHTILMSKIENIGIVSGLLLASGCNLLVAGDLRRMTFITIAASMFASILSIIFGLLCKINITPARLRFLVKRPHLFYFLYATPSLWGGGAALAFFVAICAYTWLEESTAQYGWEAKASAVVLSCALIGNAIACFILGASDITSGPGHQEEGNIIPEGNREETVNERQKGPDIRERNRRFENDLFGSEDRDLSSGLSFSLPEPSGVPASLRRHVSLGSATFGSRPGAIEDPNRDNFRVSARRRTV
ncbi:hypothetical protein M0805_007531 [Coniferiporia weirii]|nr:hypothetical protein M0805_007531 [Coniferiporia weirii]